MLLNLISLQYLGTDVPKLITVRHINDCYFLFFFH